MSAPHPARVETPADTLRAAAHAVRNASLRVTPGPWQCEQSSDEAPAIGTYEWWAVVDADDATVASVTIRGADQGNAAWIALLSPDVAEPLAAWLDDAAHWAADEFDQVHRGSPTDRALDVAQALLGVPVPEPDGEGPA